ncbi:MAG: Rieske [2Fe-2S] domain protein [Cryobacterium sp.]|jgi:Rieske Fe-S protein|nr:Rieske [2Fe-2S] domain protein [Cryobacterium sp.]
MPQPTELTRRNVILLGSAGTALALVGCSPPAEPPDGQASATPDGGGTDSKPVEVARLADVPVGSSISASLSGAPILISQPMEGTVVAFSAICTHQGCVVLPAKTELDCPCHGSRFDSATGEVLGGPASRALDPVTVTVAGDSIVAG